MLRSGFVFVFFFLFQKIKGESETKRTKEGDRESQTTKGGRRETDNRSTKKHTFKTK